MAEPQLLKKDLFGEIRLSCDGDERHIVRDLAPASPWLRWLARQLMRREASALAALSGLDGIPQILRLEQDRLVRSYVAGTPMHRNRPTDPGYWPMDPGYWPLDPGYFKSAARLLRSLHGAGVVHNDLAKEPNFLVRDDGSPAILDFQLAWYSTRRNKIFRLLGHEDLRHLLKHKRTYCPESLTRRELGILANPSVPARLFRTTVKPVYLFITRKLLGWADREGAADRGDQT